MNFDHQFFKSALRISVNFLRNVMINGVKLLSQICKGKLWYEITDKKRMLILTTGKTQFQLNASYM